MRASQIIIEIEALPPEEKAKIVRFSYRLDAERQLTGPELSAVAERMVAATVPAEAMLLRETIIRGFYGEKSHA